MDAAFSFFPQHVLRVPCCVAGRLRSLRAPWMGAALFLLAAASLLLPGCVTVPGIFSSRDIGTARYDDAGIKTAITSQLLKDDASRANDVNVHCFNGHVFLIGEADRAFREKALSVAEKAEGVVHVTTHWFPTGSASTSEDAAIEAAVDSYLLSSGDISTRRMAVDVWGGNVVLTGIMEKQAQIVLAVSKIKEIHKVKSVTSYLAVE